jgi:hypothetical protein
MKTLGKQVITTTRSGNFQYATVESIANGLATVKLSTGGVRLTNLNVYGSLPDAGSTVIVDYTTGTPYVRAAQTNSITETLMELALTPAELPSSTSYTYIFLSAGLASGSVSGTVTDYPVGSPFTFGMVAYIGGDGYAYPASNATLSTAVPFGICADNSISSGNTGTFLLNGFICSSFGFTPGGLVFLSTDGEVTQSVPEGSLVCSVVLGHACTSTLLHFVPSLSIVELI